jgi:2,4-dienoyl-CoA reductase-like NADH-dependent reductase (Old Yellow Enzyme family)
MNPLGDLFPPIQIETMELANRGILPPMGTNLGNPGGSVSAASLAYLLISP